MLRKLASLTTMLACGAGATALAAGPQQQAPTHTKRVCQRFASPAGSDGSGRGTRAQPFRSVGRLDQALRPGQTGCLRGGTYGDIHSVIALRESGRPGRRIAIRSYPGETALVRGWVDLEASYTTLSRLEIDGSNIFYTRHPAGVNCPAPASQPLTIAGHNDILEHVDYFQSVAGLRGNGIAIGFWGAPDNTVIRFSKIHDVGQCQAYDHLVYLSHGNNVQIYDNWFYNDPHGRGVQLYPAPTNARVFNNVVDHAGEGFAIGNEPGDVVSGNQIYNNIITNSTGLPSEHIPGQAIHDLYGGRPGTGNTFHNNDLFRNPGGLGHVTAVKVYRNTTAIPRFIDAARHDYELRRNSRLFKRHVGTRNYLRTP